MSFQSGRNGLIEICKALGITPLPTSPPGIPMTGDFSGSGSFDALTGAFSLSGTVTPTTSKERQAMDPILRFRLIGLLRDTIAGYGGSMSKYDPLIAKAASTNAAADWQAIIQEIIADLPQILSFVTALIALFGTGIPAPTHLKAMVARVKTMPASAGFKIGATGIDVTCSWQPGPIGTGQDTVAGFVGQWFQNGSAVGTPFSVPASPAQNPYAGPNFSTVGTANPGDQIYFTVLALGSTGLQSPAAQSNTVVIPTPLLPPSTPVSATAATVGG